MLLEDSGSIGIETGEKVSKMEPSPKRRKLDVSWRQERNRLAPVFRFLETADNSTTDDDTDSISSDHPAINNEEERATLHIGSYSNQDNQEPALNEEETCAGVLREEPSHELEIDNDNQYCRALCSSLSCRTNHVSSIKFIRASFKCCQFIKAYAVHLSSNDLSELPVSSVKCKGMLIPIANNDENSDSDDPPMPDTCFAVFPLLMQDKFR